MRRRAVLATGGAALAGLSAGCLEPFRREDAWRELVVDPPDGVYVPPHADGMVRYGAATADGREISLLATRPHSFWIVADAERDRADIRSRHDAHLMVTVRDAETGTFVPAPVATTIRARGGGDGDGDDGDSDDRHGNRVDERSLWPMLSQRMGPHYGDNVSLEGDGPYTATVRVGATTAVGAGDGDSDDIDRLEDETSVDIEFEYDAAEVEALERRLIDEDEGRGEAAALEPMSHVAKGDDDRGLGGPESTEALGTATHADIDYAAALVADRTAGDDRTDGRETDGPALAVSVRTPYNAYPLPFASLSATIARAGEELASTPLRETVDPRLGHCYTTPVDPAVLEDGDELTIYLETPPQVARHEGYETAFLESASVTMTLEAW